MIKLLLNVFRLLSIGYTSLDKKLPIQKRFERKDRIIQKRIHQSPYL